MNTHHTYNEWSMHIAYKRAIMEISSSGNSAFGEGRKSGEEHMGFCSLWHDTRSCGTGTIRFLHPRYIDRPAFPFSK